MNDRCGLRAFGSTMLPAWRFVFLVSWAACASGCQLVENPFEPILGDHQAITTPSVEGVRAAGVAPVSRSRGFARSEVAPTDGAVTHGPLYFEDVSEETTSAELDFAWDGGDFLANQFLARRMLVNLALFPISAVVMPPWTVMVSDGQASRRVLWAEYDAEPAARRGGSSSPEGSPPEPTTSAG